MNIESLRRRLAERKAAIALKSNSQLWSALQAYLAKTNSTGCGLIDYWQLYRYVRKHRPSRILECGVGASTVVLAHAVMENGEGTIVSMEESEPWFAEACRLIPRDWPVEIALSETEECCFGIFRGMRYKNLPHRPYDFVFVDGPSYRTASGQVAFDFDFISVVERAESPVAAIIDKRVSTCFVLQRVLPGKVRYVPHWGLGFVEPVTRRNLAGINAETPSASFKLRSRVDFA